MRAFRVRGTQVHINPLLALVLFGAYVLGTFQQLMLGLGALLLHETSHALIAAGMGYRVSSIEIMPFGGVARVSGTPNLPAELAIAAAGPVCSMVVASGCGMMLNLRETFSPALSDFMQANLMLATLNLMPALPLDGGRIVRALLSRFLRARLATMITAWLGVLFGAVLTGMSVYYFLSGTLQATMAMMGIFLVICAIRELTRIPQVRLEAMLRRKDTLRWGEAVPLRHIAMHEKTPASDVIGQLADNHYNLILVVGDDMGAVGELDEGGIFAGVAAKGTQVTVGELLQDRKSSAHSRKASH